MATMTHTHTEVSPLGLRRYYVAWQSDSDGDAELRFDGIDAPRIEGLPSHVGTSPNAALAPTDNYDVYLYDQYDNDILSGEGANRDTANAEIAMVADEVSQGNIDVATLGDLRLAVANAGASKAGLILLYVVSPPKQLPRY